MPITEFDPRVNYAIRKMEEYNSRFLDEDNPGFQARYRGVKIFVSKSDDKYTFVSFTFKPPDGYPMGVQNIMVNFMEDNFFPKFQMALKQICEIAISINNKEIKINEK
jgi:hypothetical protein